jgi:phosphatidate cytidylyltransferase
MGKRTITGLIMAGFLFLALYLTSFSQFVFDGVVLLVGLIATYEMYSATKNATTKIEGKQGYNTSIASLIFAGVIIYPLCYFYGYTGLLFTAILSIFLAFIVFIFDSKKTFNDFTVNVFIIFYPLIFLGLLFIMSQNYGMIPVILALGISTISDAMAYWFGVTMGKKKIFPKISPKKTYAGCLGGLFGGSVGGIIVYLIFEFGGFPTNTQFTFGSLVGESVLFTIIIYAAIGLVIAVFSEIGDLAASRIKREVGIKDYGKILGSHGGIMDRIDSILFTTVCVALIMQIISLVV